VSEKAGVPRKSLVLLAILIFVSVLLWTTLSSQKVSCEVCVQFDGGRNCATASADSEAAAARSAQTTACGVLAKGMNGSIACSNTTPLSRRCSRP
jgi:hypothetical protein